jgi:His-Xaa-Ser repeat protein HxsA
MARKGAFLIPTLIAAGLTPFGAAISSGDQSAPGAGVREDSFLDNLKKIVSGVDESHRFTLAGHRSHGSHSSHSSHRSSSYRITPDDGAAKVMTASLSTRNERSTPPNSVLPSTPAIAGKLKVLPGNSAKFQELVTQLQVALQVRGYEAGEIDGTLHARTVAALYHYQKDSGMIPSGKVTPHTLSSLGIIAQ